MRGPPRLAGAGPLDGRVIRSPNAEEGREENKRACLEAEPASRQQGRPRRTTPSRTGPRAKQPPTPTSGNACSRETAGRRAGGGMTCQSVCRQVAQLNSEWHGPHLHSLLARRITFDMRGSTRLAGASPLDGRVRHRHRLLHQGVPWGQSGRGEGNHPIRSRRCTCTCKRP